MILIQCRRGKQEGFDTLVAAWQKPLFYYVRRLVERDDDAWDVLQETWLCIFRSIRSVKSADALPVWLYRVARNNTFSFLRKQGRWKAMTEVIDDRDLANIPDWEPEYYSARAIHDAIDGLPLIEREVMTFHYLEGYQVKEIAEIIGEPVGTISSRMFRAKRNLRRLIEEKEAGDE